MKIFKEQFKNTWLYKTGYFILTSAPIALLLSLVLFWIEMAKNEKESDELIAELIHIEESLSTNYLGLFPNYLDQINQVLSETKSGDSIVIIEDFLFYGLFYNPAEFKTMMNHITTLSQQGHHITIAYYGPKTPMFRSSVKAARIDPKYTQQINKKRREILDDTTHIHNRVHHDRDCFLYADSLACEYFFAQTKHEDMHEFKKRLKTDAYLLYQHEDDAPLFKELDEIRKRVVDKPAEDITFQDFFVMYQELSNAISRQLKSAFKGNIELIELHDYLALSCWNNSKRMIFALPGKFAATEIGFSSRDQSLQNYIHMQISGARDF